jgi:hypothetical protein
MIVTFYVIILRRETREWADSCSKRVLDGLPKKQAAASRSMEGRMGSVDISREHYLTNEAQYHKGYLPKPMNNN